MSSNDVPSEVESSHVSAKTNRREVLIALGVGMTAPLFGCGGGGGGTDTAAEQHAAPAGRAAAARHHADRYL